MQNKKHKRIDNITTIILLKKVESMKKNINLDNDNISKYDDIVKSSNAMSISVKRKRLCIEQTKQEIERKIADFLLTMALKSVKQLKIYIFVLMIKIKVKSSTTNQILLISLIQMMNQVFKKHKS